MGFEAHVAGVGGSAIGTDLVDRKLAAFARFPTPGHKFCQVRSSVFYPIGSGQRNEALRLLVLALLDYERDIGFTVSPQLQPFSGKGGHTLGKYPGVGGTGIREGIVGHKIQNIGAVKQ